MATLVRLKEARNEQAKVTFRQAVTGHRRTCYAGVFGTVAVGMSTGYTSSDPGASSGSGSCTRTGTYPGASPRFSRHAPPDRARYH